jgi:hypothetical protein
VHLSGRDVDNSVLAVYGIKEANEPATGYCKKCGLPVDSLSGDKIEGLLIEFLKIVAGEFPQVKNKFREVVKERGAEGLFKT